MFIYRNAGLAGFIHILSLSFCCLCRYCSFKALSLPERCPFMGIPPNEMILWLFILKKTISEVKPRETVLNTTEIHLKMAKMEHSMLCILYHNNNIKEPRQAEARPVTSHTCSGWQRVPFARGSYAVINPLKQ